LSRKTIYYVLIQYYSIDPVTIIYIADAKSFTRAEDRSAMAPQTAAEAATKTEEFHETLKADAENVILQTLPERIIHFYELLDTPEHRIPRSEFINYKFEVPETAIGGSENCNAAIIGRCAADAIPTPLQPMLVPSNKNVTEIVEIFKPSISQLVRDSRSIRMWITLSTPSIEDGNNFGVSVQKNVLGVLRQVESAAVMYYDKVNSYYENRGKLVAKAVKYPFIEDYRIAVEELDEKQYTGITMCIYEIYFCYTLLYDVIVKNFENIKNPRTTSNSCSDGMY